MSFEPILNCDSQAMEALNASLASLADELDRKIDAWPKTQLEQCAEAGVFRWFLDPCWGGLGWAPNDILAGYMQLSAACLTTTFVITQRMGACQRIAKGPEALAGRLLPDLLSGRTFATVGISHLTTSRRHLGKPALSAVETDRGFVLNGYSPWCTGAPHADYVVLGAELDDGRQVLVVASMQWDGIHAADPAALMALTASQTGAVICEGVEIPHDWVLAGPVEDVMRSGTGARTGGLQTSVLAAGLARAASGYLSDAAENRSDLRMAAAAFSDETEGLCADLMAAAIEPSGSDPAALRRRANSLVIRSTQAALTAAKGAGYVAGHPVGRWCREAMFFLVWSCPQPVVAANLCELAGIESFE